MDWQRVTYGRGYAKGFDPKKTLEFRRPEWDEPKTFRLADQHPLFNVLGLEWREPQ